MPVGYQRTRQGAIDAATSYVVTLDGPLLLQPDGLRRAEDLMSTSEYRAELETQREALREQQVEQRIAEFKRQGLIRASDSAVELARAVAWPGAWLP